MGRARGGRERDRRNQNNETPIDHDQMGRARGGRERRSGVEHTMSQIPRAHDLWAEPMPAVNEGCSRTLGSRDGAISQGHRSSQPCAAPKQTRDGRRTFARSPPILLPTLGLCLGRIVWVSGGEA
jgi:hypothetical protein